MKFDNMVASDSIMISVFIIVALSLVSYPFPTEGKGLIRSRRQETNPCVDGTYEYENRNCCRCGAGQKLIDHCTVSPDDGKCALCENNTYSSHPNFQTSCELCTHCNDNAHLEVHERCKPAKDTKCRCKEGFYCGGGEEPCKLCSPCKECEANGIKVACTATNDTVCNDKPEGGNNLSIILGVVIPLLIAIILIAPIVFWRRRKRRIQKINQQADLEMQPLKVERVDLTPHLPDIAEVIGWNDMKTIAMRTGISQPVIDACQLDQPNQTVQQTIQLLKTWVEHQGMNASVNLIRNLEKSGKKLTAEKVIAILPTGSDTQSA